MLAWAAFSDRGDKTGRPIDVRWVDATLKADRFAKDQKVNTFDHEQNARENQCINKGFETHNVYFRAA